MLFQLFPGGFSALTEPVAAMTKPGPFLFDDAKVGSQVEDRADARDPFVEEDVEFRKKMPTEVGLGSSLPPLE